MRHSSRSPGIRSLARSRTFLEPLEDRLLFATTPTGSVDIFSRTQIVGWAKNVDDGQGAVNIEITVGASKSTLSANQLRSDLAIPLGSPYHGFVFTMPTLPPGATAVKVEAVSVSTGIRKTLKSGALTNPAPVGNVDLLSATRLVGWAIDSDSGSPINIRIDIDGVAGTPFATNVARADVTAVFGVTNPGFDVTNSFAGHVVEVFAIDAPSGVAKLLYTNNKKPIGSVDVNNGLTVSGWAIDLDSSSSSISVRVDIDGVTLAGTPAVANVTRNDLTAVFGSPNHGFSISIPGLTPGTHTISVYAIDGQASSQAPVLIGSKIVTNKPPVGRVDVLNSNTVVGWALDPDLGSAAATINVYIDDSLFGTFTASNSRPDLTKPFGSPNHGFSVDLSSLPAGSHAVTLTVVDNRTSDENEIVFFDDFINNHAPVGSIDAVSGTQIQGWAMDIDSNGAPIEVDIYVDGVYAATVTADDARADLDAVLPTPNHAFTATLPALSFGSHKIDIYAAESQGNVSVLIGSKTVTNKRPIGAVDVLNTTTVSGWAADPDRLGESVTVRIYVNGALAVSGTASNARPDLIAVSPFSTVPGFNAYGFSLSISLSSGRNQIDVYIVDPNNSMLSPISSSVINI